MQEHQHLSDKEITDDLVAPVMRSDRWFWSVVGFLGFFNDCWFVRLCL